MINSHEDNLLLLGQSSSTLGGQVKHYPLNVQGCICDTGYAAMSKGHHDSAEFEVAVSEWWGEELAGWEKPRHTWWRAVPDVEYRCRYIIAKPFSRGAFPVTFMETM